MLKFLRKLIERFKRAKRSKPLGPKLPGTSRQEHRWRQTHRFHAYKDSRHGSNGKVGHATKMTVARHLRRKRLRTLQRQGKLYRPRQHRG